MASDGSDQHDSLFDHSPMANMSFGQHLEELRRRIVLALIGVGVACLVTFYYGETLIWWLQQPLNEVQRRNGLPAQTYSLTVTTGFAVYMKVSFVAGVILAGPWVVYQLWRFVSAGLYANERKSVLLLTPFSALMSLLGVAFAYYVMLPISLMFLIGFATSYPAAGEARSAVLEWLNAPMARFVERQDSDTPDAGKTRDVPLPNTDAKSDAKSNAKPDSKSDKKSDKKSESTPNSRSADGDQQTTHGAGDSVADAGALESSPRVPILASDPPTPAEGQLWINARFGEMKVHYQGRTRTLPLAVNSLLSPMIEIGQYISFVTVLMLGIVIGFQTPLVMLVIGSTGLVDPAMLKPYRKHAFLICLVLSAALTPADPISMFVLGLPLWLLFVLGLFLMRRAFERWRADLPPAADES